MTAVKTCELLCDSTLCPSKWTGGPGQYIATVRIRARRAGWRYVPFHLADGPGRDLCPTHAKETIDA